MAQGVWKMKEKGIQLETNIHYKLHRYNQGCIQEICKKSVMEAIKKEAVKALKKLCKKTIITD